MSIEVQNSVTATAEDAASIIGREPSAQEIAATDAAQDAAIEQAVSLEDYTTRVVVVAIGAHDRATFNGVSAVALRLCMAQAKVTAGNGLYAAETDEFIMNRIYFDAALAGKQIFRNTKDTTDSADMVAAIVEKVAAGDMDTARKLARDYVMTWGKGRKLVKALALLRQDGVRLASYMRDHAAVLIGSCAAMTKDKGEHKLAAQTWRKAVLDRFGETFATMSDKLESLYGKADKGKSGKAKPAKAKPAETAQAAAENAAETAQVRAEAAPTFILSNDATDADRIAAIFDIVGALSAEGFASLVHRINAEAEARATATVTDAEFTEAATDPAPAVTGPVLALPAPAPAETVEPAPVEAPKAKRGRGKAVAEDRAAA